MFFTQGANFMLISTLCIYFLYRKKDERLREVVAWVLALMSFLNLKDMFIPNDTTDKDSEWQMLLIMVDMLAVPAFGLLLFELVQPYSCKWKDLIIHVSPFMICLLAYIVFHSGKIVIATEVWALIYGGLIVVKTLRSVHIRADANPDVMRAVAKYTTLLLGLMAIFLTVCLLSCVMITDLTDTLYYICSMGLWLTIGYIIDQRFIPTDRRSKQQRNVEDNIIGLKIQVEFIDKKTYLDPTITLEKTARIIRTNRTYLSEYFNRIEGKSFNDYVNLLRLQEAILLLETQPNMTLDEIAHVSGFNSSSTFRRAFFKRHGMTPSSYRAIHVDQKS